MKHFLSHGGGVNSTAYYLYLLELGIEFEAVFAHHGADHPKTYEYMEYFNNECIKRGWEPVTIIKAEVKEKDMQKGLNLFEYCLEKQIMPVRAFRWCTEKFKTIPVNAYINSKLEDGEKCYMHLGIAADEEHRAKPPQNPPVYARSKVYRYMFVEDGIDRQGNIEIIKKYGFDVPPKSGCYICPFAKNKEFRELYEKDRCLYEKAKLLEKGVNKRRTSRGQKPIYLKEYPLEIIAQEGQVTLIPTEDGFEYLDDYKPCNCGL